MGNARIRSSSNGVVVALLGAGIGATATIGAVIINHIYDKQERICEYAQTRFDKIDTLVDRAPKLRRIRDFIGNEANKKCNCYKDAVAESEDLQREILDESPKEPIKSEHRQALQDNSLIEGRSMAESGQPSVALPAIPSRPLENPRPAPTDFVASAVPGPDAVQHSQPPAIAFARPPLLIKPYADPSKPFDGGVGDSLVLGRDLDYTLLPDQDTTTTYTVTQGKLAIYMDGQPYFYCSKGDKFHLYWKHSPNFGAKTTGKIAEVKVFDAEPGKHLGTTSCTDTEG